MDEMKRDDKNLPGKPDQEERSAPEIPGESELKQGFLDAFRLVDDVVLKNYIPHLPELPVVPLDEKAVSKNTEKIRLFRITEMVYERNESATYKFASVFNAVAATNSTIVTVIDSDGAETDFYLGIRSLSDENSTQTSYNTLVNAMNGQFPGIGTENLKEGKIKSLLSSIDTSSLSAVSCVANNKNKDFTDNDDYLQGLEKLALAMQGNKYTAVIIANPTSQEQLSMARQGYENIYTQLSPYANTVVSYGTNKSESQNKTETQGENASSTQTTTENQGTAESESHNTGQTQSVSGKSLESVVGSTVGATLSIAGAVIGSIIPGPGTAAGAVIGGAIGGLIGTAISMATDKTVSTTTGGGNIGKSRTYSYGKSSSKTTGTSHSLAFSVGVTTGESQNLQLTIQNKPLIDMLARIDKQLERLDEFESVGMWECAAYFMSADSSVSEVAAATYKALMSGENSGLEASAINTWRKPQQPEENKKSPNELISEYVKNFIHPVFEYKVLEKEPIPVMPTNLVSGNELAIHMGLPRHSVCGFPVVEHADFGKEVVKYNKNESSESIQLGNIFNMGKSIDKSRVCLDVESLTMHTFIAGATGSGKSNAIYHILDKLTSTRKDISFMVIEPAKGEYKRTWGHKRGVSVFGTNPEYTELLRINPFKFPKHVHVLEHIDRLIEIFNVCWPMYAAMPAVLKDAVLETYESCGWDISTSKNWISDNQFPTFQDLLEQLVKVIDASEYSNEVKSNYKGSLLTRVKSLTNGLNGMIFAANEIDNKILFDTNVIVDISRVGSQETKSLLMGILVMRLSEYRMDTCTKFNSKLKHITVLEEAHNILRSTADNSSSEEGGNVAGKSVEMISNAIAEMRTYGEGFIIADQSPGAVDISAIRNTNTKIIMRLPEESDRRLLGKAAALKDTQLDEIARLPRGVAVVYQNDWIESVLCQIKKFNGEEKDYEYSSKAKRNQSKAVNSVLVNFVLKNRLDSPDLIVPVDIEQAIEKCECSVHTKNQLHSLLQNYRYSHKLQIWSEESFSEQACLVRDILRLEKTVNSLKRASCSDMQKFRCALNTLVSQKIDAPSEDLVLSLSHCLMKAYSDSGEGEKEFYKQWREEVEGRRHLL